ncbi:hypothetical protein LSAT2_001517 [Lamellibrachia satsuma]|nr:hypothetical protein LSAT2_001517 [Lamellibrachia satsuma]
MKYYIESFCNERQTSTSEVRGDVTGSNHTRADVQEVSLINERMKPVIMWTSLSSLRQAGISRSFQFIDYAWYRPLSHTLELLLLVHKTAPIDVHHCD